MRRSLFGFFVLAILCLGMSAHAGAPREIVVAIRYLQAEGTSHAHLYLYREDGKLLRQLTSDNTGQDSIRSSPQTARALSSAGRKARAARRNSGVLIRWATI